MSKFKKNILPVTTFARIDIKRLFRDKVAIFFVFIFPLIFLLIFGSIFSDNNDVSFRVALLSNSGTEYSVQFEQTLKDSEVFNIDETVTTLERANEKMNRGELEATIILPEGFGAVAPGNEFPSGNAEVLYNQSNESGGQALASILNAIFSEINQELVDTQTPFTVSSKSTATEGSRRFDYTFAGIMGFTILSLGIFGPTTVFPRLKQKGVLRRYQSTNLKVWQYFTGNVISNAFVGILALIVMFLAAVIVFNLNMRGSYLLLAFIVAFGTILLFGIGLAIGGWAKNENQAAPISQLIVLPMMFLSGVFFPTFLMPEFLQNVTKFIPLTAIIDSIRLIITENASVADLAPQLGIMAIWTVVIYAIAFKLFRWE